WDTSTNNNVMSSTTPQKYTWMSAPQASFSSWNGKYLAVEYWQAIQYSGSTSTTTTTETTVSTASDIITPGWDSARTLTGSLSLAGKEIKGLARLLTGSLGTSSSLVEHSSLHRSLSALLSFTSSETKGLTKILTGSLSLAGKEIKGLARLLTGSLGTSSSLV